MKIDYESCSKLIHHNISNHALSLLYVNKYFQFDKKKTGAFVFSEL